MASCTKMDRSRRRWRTVYHARLLSGGGDDVMVRSVTGLTERRSTAQQPIGSSALAGPSARGVRSGIPPSQERRPSPCFWTVWEALPHDGRTRTRPTRAGMVSRLGSRL